MTIFSRKNLLFLALAAMVSILAGCEPSDANKDYGFPKIYIPQATVTGMDNSYPIPNGPLDQNKTYVCNFKDGKLNIALGVVRAGALAKEKVHTYLYARISKGHEESPLHSVHIRNENDRQHTCHRKPTAKGQIEKRNVRADERESCCHCQHHSRRGKAGNVCCFCHNIKTFFNFRACIRRN